MYIYLTYLCKHVKDKRRLNFYLFSVPHETKIKTVPAKPGCSVILMDLIQIRFQIFSITWWQIYPLN